MRMLDLFSGLGGASQAMRQRGWDVVSVDADPAFNCTITADLTSWTPAGLGAFDLVWASPPCTEFSRDHLPWLRGKYPPPCLDLVRAALRIIAAVRPTFWVVENVRGAIRWFRPLLGPVRQQLGPLFLWGDFPRLDVVVKPWKQTLSSPSRAERAMVPAAVSAALAVACESSLLSQLAGGAA